MQIKKYVLTLIIIVIISSMVEIIMPDGKFKKHISLVTGLVMLFTIAKPILSFKSFSFNNVNFEDLIYEDVASVSHELSDKLTKAGEEEIDNKFEQTLAENISNKIYKIHNIKCDVRVLFKNGLVERLIIFSKENEKIRNTIKECYGLNCVFEEG